LHMKSRLLTYRTTNVAHQGAVTRSKGLFLRNQRQIEQSTRKYQAAYNAMVSLVGEENVGWRKLHDSDVRMMDGAGDRAVGIKRKQKGKKSRSGHQEDEESEDEAELAREPSVAQRLKEVRGQGGEGYRETSWIWVEGGTGKAVDDETLENSKCFARNLFA
jgi:hypothetical protein